jgi:hypothetical protein
MRRSVYGIAQMAAKVCVYSCVCPERSFRAFPGIAVEIALTQRSRDGKVPSIRRGETDECSMPRYGAATGLVTVASSADSQAGIIEWVALKQAALGDGWSK